jgi:hypothetical protein
MIRRVCASAFENRRWLAPLAVRSLLDAVKPATRGEVHLILAIADHYEPDDGFVSLTEAQERVEFWVREYPRALGSFRDADGRPPRHTFFYPIETYRAEHLDALAGLCRQGFGEVEIHLHHDGDTADGLRARLKEAVAILTERHGLLARDRQNTPAFGFVHGNWALNNSRPDGRWCGVNDEIRVLREAGCYADFTFPSAPSPTQPPTFNRPYYATSTPCHPRGHDRGIAVGHGPAPANSLLLVPGPLRLEFGRRKRSILPSLENGCVQASQPATGGRVDSWLRAGVRVPSRPDWYFVKLHCHGAHPRDHATLLGAPMIEFHRALAQRAAEDKRFHVHYVTTRELYNLVKAAEAGWTGGVAEARDHVLRWGGGDAPNRSARRNERRVIV